MAEAKHNVTVNMNVNWGDLDLHNLAGVVAEMQHAREKYSVAHDDAHGSRHLIKEAVNRLTHMGEFPSDGAVKLELKVAIGLLFNAIAVIDRVYEIGTFSAEEEAQLGEEPLF